MARMFPDRIPAQYRDEPARDAECAVYEALIAALSDEYAVFGWAAWVSKKPSSGAHNNEADFVIAHPEHGVLVLEVKGGVIGHDAVTGTWTSTSMNDVVHVLKESPFEQATRHRYDLERKLKESPGWPAAPRPFGWAVAFPDCKAPAGDLGLNSPRELVLEYNDLDRLAERIAAIGKYWRGSENENRGAPLGDSGMDVVIRVLAKSFKLRMPLGRAIKEDDRRFIELTETQFSVLDGLSGNRRVLVTGGAGTGKTLLALEQAKRLARDNGFRTLLTCFNLPLAEYLKASSDDVPNLTVLNFHELCADFARRAGREVNVPAGDAAANEYFRHELPALLVDALTVLPDRFEAIVLDEGQDFTADNRAALELALEDREESVLYVFQDQTQAIYRDATLWPEAGMMTYVLTENRRNTRAIHEVLGQLAGDTRTRALGPAGTAPEFILARDGREQAKELSRVLHRLIREESVAPGTIAVLVSSRRGEPALVEDGRIGAFEVTTEHDADDGRVLFESVTRFKGLERDVVILTRLDEVEYVEYAPMLYVGASRARSLLIVIGDQETLARFGATPA